MKPTIILMFALTTCLQINAEIGDSFSENSLIFTVISDECKEVSVKAISDSDFGCLTIPSTIVDNSTGTRYTITEIQWRGFAGATLTEVIIPETVTDIGTEAFLNCKTLEYVSLPNSLTRIHQSAFRGSGITTISIPESVIIIEDSTFSNCDNLVSVNLSCSVKKIYQNAFAGCTHLSNINLNYVTDIGASAFENCESLTSLVIPNNICSIDSKAFAGCSMLREVYYCSENPIYADWDVFNSEYFVPVIENFIDEIYEYGKLYVPESAIQEYLMCSPWCFFKNIKGYDFQTGVVSSGNNSESILPLRTFSDDDFQYIIISEKNKEVAVRKKPNHWYAQADITIPEEVFNLENQEYYTVTSIWERGFNVCYNVTGVNIPKTIKIIGKNAFADCHNLEHINIPESVIIIQGRAFYECSALTTVNISGFISRIEPYTFYNCRNLTSVSIPETITNIGKEAFWGCNSLSSIDIPDSVLKIGKNAFSQCPNLNFIKLSDNLLMIGESCFAGTSIDQLTIPESVEIIEDKAFSYCRNLRNISLSSNLKIIGRQIFHECLDLESIYYNTENLVKGMKDIFDDTTYTNATLYIQSNVIPRSKEINPWKNFIDIKPSQSHLKEIAIDFDWYRPYFVYNLNGMKVADSTSGLNPGIYIVTQNGISNKIVVK